MNEDDNGHRGFEIRDRTRTRTIFLSEKRYENDFEELILIGEGGFGSVYQVKNKIDDEIYAIKKINSQGKNFEQ